MADGSNVVHHLIPADLVVGVKPARPHKRATLGGALRQAAKAGADVSGATLAADGSVSLTFVSGARVNGGDEANPWDVALSHEAIEKRSS
jgi:hypothetical protein